jgi:hypothetical protein
LEGGWGVGPGLQFLRFDLALYLQEGKIDVTYRFHKVSNYYTTKN